MIQPCVSGIYKSRSTENIRISLSHITCHHIYDTIYHITLKWNEMKSISNLVSGQIEVVFVELECGADYDDTLYLMAPFRLQPYPWWHMYHQCFPKMDVSRQNLFESLIKTELSLIQFISTPYLFHQFACFHSNKIHHEYQGHADRRQSHNSYCCSVTCQCDLFALWNKYCNQLSAQTTPLLSPNL